MATYCKTIIPLTFEEEDTLIHELFCFLVEPELLQSTQNIEQVNMWV